MTDDAVKDIRNSTDFADLKGLLAPLLAQPCLRAELSYNGELEVHFGEPVPYRHPKLEGQSKGAWVLQSLATPWLLQPNRERGDMYPFGPAPLGLVHFPGPVEVVKEHLSALSGKQVSAFEISPNGDLSLEFNEESVLLLLARYAQPDPEFPVWELSAPDHLFFQVWGDPVPAWSRLRSDVPLC